MEQWASLVLADNNTASPPPTFSLAPVSAPAISATKPRHKRKRKELIPDNAALSSSSSSSSFPPPDGTTQENTAAETSAKKKKKKNSTKDRPDPAPSRFMRWVANADKRAENGQGPLEWTDIDSSGIVKSEVIISSSAETLMPDNFPAGVEIVLPPLYKTPENASPNEKRRFQRNQKVSGKEKAGDYALKFDIFQILRLVFQRFLSWEMYNKAWGIAMPASRSILMGDWNGTNIIILLVRELKKPNIKFPILNDKFSQEMMDRVNNYRRLRPGWLTLQDIKFRFDAELDAEENSGVQELLTE